MSVVNDSTKPKQPSFITKHAADTATHYSRFFLPYYLHSHGAKLGDGQHIPDISRLTVRSEAGDNVAFSSMISLFWQNAFYAVLYS